jgi:hypothetical protein
VAPIRIVVSHRASGAPGFLPKFDPASTARRRVRSPHVSGQRDIDRTDANPNIVEERENSGAKVGRHYDSSSHSLLSVM